MEVPNDHRPCMYIYIRKRTHMRIRKQYMGNTSNGNNGAAV